MTEATEPPAGATRTVRSDRRALDAADAARVATFAALIAVLGLPGSLSLFGNAVPITLQTLGVMLAGAVLGARRGALAVLTLLALAAAGLPLLAGGRGGLGVFVGPSAGYLAGFVAGAFVVGLMVERLRRVTFTGVLVAALVGGVGVVYAFGLPVQALVTGVPLPQTAWLSLAFLPGDVLKAVACAGITVAVTRAYPAALRHRTREG
ncbi:biotin transport system substrate-specific component [Isoptericola sp. CG 20/1183]|uniref:Biotin transporter n=1 Tax=Isoptericola halotolerans TaxID=300560 RepID=A0ABX5EEN0_9MICO|nr:MULTISPECIES: biotin transporter BioY [Isoptericola]PRZ07602.1 biotin transport system substrate-specific component [Isoptericola halotolerans]PRZ08039.1 biotin transport system substrate-specific component [Isoptericola sp. CG 20/1183]